MSHLGSDILKKMHNINEEFKWYFKFLEEAFKLVGAKESAYWLREDFAKCLESWSIYCDEKNKGKPRRTISMQCKVSKN